MDRRQKDKECALISMVLLVRSNGYCPIRCSSFAQGARRLHYKSFMGNEAVDVAGAGLLMKVDGLLTYCGVDVNHQHTRSGDTMLIASSRSGHADVVDLLLKRGATVGLSNKVSRQVHR